ncbi:MAG: VCBS repeat-containing protein [Armatimonadota bacterium]
MRCTMWAVCIVVLCASSLAAETANADGPITQLKDLHLNTALVAHGDPAAVIVTPENGDYDAEARSIQTHIEQATGVKLPIRVDTAVTPAELLRSRSAIALGNMATSSFIYTLYREYYTFLDLKYPGPGGYVVRSLHDPYGTGTNVMFIGGSDDSGVRRAAEVFCSKIEPGDDPVMGRLMEIELGEGPQPPDVGEQLYTWRDSYREFDDGTHTGYDPATYFGWNPISSQAALYYMTGEAKYLEEYLRLALPDPDNIPKELSSCYAFARKDCDLEHPLVGTYHYRAHLQELMFDLIEDSPLLDDETRLEITNEMLARQDFLDPDDTWSSDHGLSRHGCYDALSIYTGSRYFAKYYPADRWEKRLANVKRTMSWWLKHPTWGERDTLYWITTSTEPVIEYWMFEAPQVFVQSGVAETMMKAIEILWRGTRKEEANYDQTQTLMHRASWLLDAGEYAWLVRKAQFNMDRFRIGQSWWPGPEMDVSPPEHLVNRVSVMPLPQPRAEQAETPFDASEGYQFLSYRNGLGPTDGYLFLDGFNDRGRNPHHVSTLYRLRMQGRRVLKGYWNQVFVNRDGLVTRHVARGARLDRATAIGNSASIRSVVPDAPFCEWQRDVMWVDEKYILVADVITAHEDGDFNIACRWAPTQNLEVSSDDGRRCVLQSDSDISVVSAQPVQYRYRSPHTLEASLNRPRAQGEAQSIFTAVYPDSDQGAFDYRLEPVGENAVRVEGKETALYCIARLADENSGIQIDAQTAFVRANCLRMFDGEMLQIGDIGVRADRPVTLSWNVAEGTAEVVCDEAATLRFSATGENIQIDGSPAHTSRLGEMLVVSIPAGRHSITGLAVDEGTSGAIEKAVTALPVIEQRRTEKKAAQEPDEWEPLWSAELPGTVTETLTPGEGPVERIWFSTEEETDDESAFSLVRMASDGETELTMEMPARVNCLVAAETEAGRMILVGGDDDVLRALDPEGNELWTAESHVSETFREGDGWYAPWFTDPERKWGIRSLMVADLGNGQQEIILGRSSTMEFWSLDGELIERVPINFGDLQDLALLELPDGSLQVLGAQWDGGNAFVSIVGANHKVVTNGGYRFIPSGGTSMRQWQQQGVAAVETADLDGDAVEEVVVARSGHWNDVRTLTHDEKPIWQQVFGPAEPRSRFVADVAVGDINGDGAVEIVAGLASGRVLCFSSDGTLLWSKALGDAVRCLATYHGGIAAGMKNGTVVSIRADGTVERARDLGPAVNSLSLAAADEPLVLATAGSQAAAFSLNQ